MNSVIITGRMTADAELKTTANGTEVTTFCVAVKRNYSKDVDFINCVAWREQAKFISTYFHKGDPIEIQGELQVRRYEHNGENRTAVEVKTNVVDFTLQRKKEDNEPQEEPQEEQTNVATANFESVADDEPLPF